MNETIWIIDPAHAWLQVPYRALADAGMGVSDFSRYSYYSASKQCVWLEEDCDLPKFMAKATVRYGLKAVNEGIVEQYTDAPSRIRNERHIGN